MSPSASAGIIDTTASALDSPNCAAWKERNCETTTGSVVAFVLVRSSAKKKSVQEKMNANAAAETIPGAASGHATFQSDCQREQPSTSAASSSSTGICRKYVYIIQIENGSVKIV